MNIDNKEQVVDQIRDHFSERGTGQRFIRWAKRKGVVIHPEYITRAKKGQVSAFSTLVFLTYIEKINEFE